MSGPGLSAEQQRAVTAPLGDVCVTAGAGSGKTRVLAARFVEHVRVHGLSPARVAALTFTEKAARQMRTRIAEALGGDPALADPLAAAPISTFHAFCARLLRRNAVSAGLDPAFRVLDDTAAVLLRREAEQRVGAELSADPGAGALWAALARLSSRQPLSEAARLLEALRGLGGEAADLGWSPGPVGAAAARVAVEAALAEVEREAHAAGVAAGVPPFAALVRRALDGDVLAQEALLRPSGVYQPGTSKPFKALRDARDAVGEAVQGYVGACLDEEAARDVLPGVRAVLVRLEAAGARLKRREEALDFADLERETLRLLSRLSRAGRRAEGLPAALLVDEHQDTNPVQEAILGHLRALGLPQFSVGDPKQSIYRFRRADVAVLLGEQERVGAAGRRTLAESYRAAPAVVDALNGLCERLFEGRAAGVPFEPLVARGAFADAPPGAEPSVEVALLAHGALGSEEGRRREAAFVAARLRALVGGTARRARRDAERPFAWRDCAVLVRARSTFPFLERAFAEAGVPYRVHKGRGYLEADEVRALVAALRVVVNPLDRHALAALLRGPALAAEDGRLLAWFRGPDGEAHTPWERLGRDSDAAVQRLVRTIEDLRRLAAGAALPEVVAAAVERLGLDAVALAQHDGARRAANLARAVAVAEDVARAGHHDLTRFLAYLEELGALELAQAEAPASSDEGDEVSLLTVHAAKGLEWPVVVLADIVRRSPGQHGAALLSDSGRVAFRLVDPLEGSSRVPAGLEALHAAAERASDEEALRLLYVALTRAEERLLLTGTFSAPTKDGRLRADLGWASRLLEALGAGPEPGVRDLALGPGRVRLRVEDVSADGGEALPEERPGARPEPGPALATARSLTAEALERLDAPAPDLAPLGGTRFVVGVSELMAFERSPAELYAARLRAPRSAAPVLRAPPADADGERSDTAAHDPEGREQRRLARAEAWDEPAVPAAPERAAVGTAVHAALEAWHPGQALDLDGPLAEAFPAGAPPAARAEVQALVDRFAASAVGREAAAALAAGADLRREVAFHARIRFPGGARVGPFEALLVKGSIDLWLPRAGGLWILDHKTNAPSAALAAPAAVARHYAWQLRLYALAAERLTGRDVAGAALLLLHPGWGPEALEVPVDVSGPALEEARRLCRAFAVAEREDRWPAGWRGLAGG